MIKYKAWKWRTRLRLKHSIFRLNIIFRSLNFFRRITPKSPSSHTGHLFLSIPLSHLCPFSALSDSAVTPPKLKIKATSWNGNGVDKVHPFNQFFVNSVIVGEAFPIEKTQKIKRIQPIWCIFRIRWDCNVVFLPFVTGAGSITIPPDPNTWVNPLYPSDFRIFYWEMSLR